MQGALVLFGRVEEDLAVAYSLSRRRCATTSRVSTRATRETCDAVCVAGVLARLVPELVDDLPAGQVEAWAIYEGLVDWLSGEAGAATGRTGGG